LTLSDSDIALFRQANECKRLPSSMDVSSETGDTWGESMG
jgi:hypothetical protein